MVQMPSNGGITNSFTYAFCDQQQTLGHAIGGCETALLESRYNWRHDSVLLNIYKTIKLQVLQVFVDIGYPNPSIITGNEQRPDFAIVKSDSLLLLGLTVSFETKLRKNLIVKRNIISSYFLSYQISSTSHTYRIICPIMEIII